MGKKNKGKVPQRCQITDDMSEEEKERRKRRWEQKVAKDARSRKKNRAKLLGLGMEWLQKKIKQGHLIEPPKATPSREVKIELLQVYLASGKSIEAVEKFMEESGADYNLLCDYDEETERDRDLHQEQQEQE